MLHGYHYQECYTVTITWYENGAVVGYDEWDVCAWV